MSLTVVIISLTSVVSVLALRSPELIRKLVLSPVSVSQKREYFRFVTSGFIHGDLMHLAFNMFVLYSFGELLEFLFQAHFGMQSKFLFTAFYLLALIASDIPSYHKNRHNPHYASLGASGAVSAVIFAVIAFEPLLPMRFLFFPFFDIPGVVMGAAYLYYEYDQGKKARGRINHDAHFYGALFGVVFVVVMRPVTVFEFFEKITAGLL